jgi:hypothetical protein
LSASGTPSARPTAAVSRITLEQNEFLPDRYGDVVAERDGEAGFLSQSEKFAGAFRRASIPFPERHRHERSRLPDHAGTGDRRADGDGAGHDMRGAEDGQQAVAGVDAVL